MLVAIGSAVRKSASGVVNLVVLAILIIIAWWGHKTHWKMPKFAVLLRSSVQSPVPAEQAGEHALAGADSNGSPQPGANGSEVNSLASAGAGGYPAIRFATADAARNAGITIGSVQERRMDEFVTAFGTVTYAETHLAQLSCRVSGFVWKVLKKLGDPVHEGDVLAILDSAEVGRAKAELLEADLDYDLKSQNLSRMKVATSSLPARQLREADADVRKASVRRFNARQTLINMGLSISVQRMGEATDEELARQIHFLGLPTEIVSHLDPETASANLIPLVSPMDGIVIKREVVTGEVVDPSHVQFVVADVRHMWLNLNVRKSDASELAVGQEVAFSLTDPPDEILSKVSWIATEVDPKTRNVQVRAELDNRMVGVGNAEEGGQWLLRANTFGTGRIRVRRRPTILSVPATAVQWDGVHHLIFVAQSDGTTFLPRKVDLGITRDGYCEICTGAKRGEPVVTSGAYVLKSELVGIDK